ncbi:MAG: DUF368 domain-containing protein [Actinomycetota bacterium]|nr:DUF368 domain-containing protein [Actinomycetota bacterium]
MNKKKLILFLKGTFMGIAEIIPGVSGGTIAFITGIYEELIYSIKSVDLKAIKLFSQLQLRNFWKHINGNFLITLVSGMAISILLFSRIISYLLDFHPFKIWGLFFGLIIASAIFILKKIDSFNFLTYLSLIFGLLLASYISLVSPTMTSNSSISIFASGAIAISAMILPGISGSFILVFLSKYEFILNALNEFNFEVLSIFILGCIFGLVFFSRIITFLFNRFSSVVISLLVGFLFGSLIKIWPFYEVIEYNLKNEPVYTRPNLPTLNQGVDIIYFLVFTLIGFFSMWIIEKKYLRSNLEK